MANFSNYISFSGKVPRKLYSIASENDFTSLTLVFRNNAIVICADGNFKKPVCRIAVPNSNEDRMSYSLFCSYFNNCMAVCQQHPEEVTLSIVDKVYEDRFSLVLQVNTSDATRELRIRTFDDMLKEAFAEK